MNENELKRYLIMNDKLNAAVCVDSKGELHYGSEQKIRDFIFRI
jgi:hypothetical protein